MSNRDGDAIAAKFLQHRTSGSGRVRIDRNGEILDCSRVATDGDTIFSYEWWPIAFWIDGATIAVTSDDFEYPVTRRRWKGAESYTVERIQKSPTTRHHVESARYAVLAAGFENTGETISVYLEYGGGTREFQVFRDTSRNPGDFAPSRYGKHNQELQSFVQSWKRAELENAISDDSVTFAEFRQIAHSVR